MATSVSFGNSVFGDCNFDLKVDQADQVAFNAAFNSVSTSPNYVSCFDFDQDQDIDFADLYVFKQNFGAQASKPRPPAWAQSNVAMTTSTTVRSTGSSAAIQATLEH